MTQEAITWHAPEFDYEAKRPSWYWGSITVALLILGVAVWQRNFLFGVFIVIAEVLILVWAGREPRTVAFTLAAKGLTIGGRKFYPLSEFESFSVADADHLEWPNIVFQFRRRFRPNMKVNVARAELAEVERTLRASVTEVEREESVIDSLEKFSGF